MKYVDGINFVVLVLAVIAFAILTGLVNILNHSFDERDRMAKAHAEEIKQLQAEKAAIDELYKSVISAGETQRLQDQAAVNALYGALTECQELHKASERQTVEVEATIPERPKRTSRKKKVESDG